MFAADETMATLKRLEPGERRLLAEFCRIESMMPWYGHGDRRMLRALGEACESLFPAFHLTLELRKRLTARSSDHHALLLSWTRAWLRRGTADELLSLAALVAMT